MLSKHKFAFGLLTICRFVIQVMIVGWVSRRGGWISSLLKDGTIFSLAVGEQLMGLGFQLFRMGRLLTDERGLENK